MVKKKCYTGNNVQKGAAYSDVKNRYCSAEQERKYEKI